MEESTTSPEAPDPMKLTIEHLESIGKIWGDFAKAKFGPYVDQSKKLIEKYKKTPAEPEKPEESPPATA
jgi:hypothetical protein